MKLTIAGGIVVVLGVAFIAGAFTTSPVLLISSFCLAPFSLIYFGWVLGRAGLNIHISMSTNEGAQSRAPRRVRGASFDG